MTLEKAREQFNVVSRKRYALLQQIKNGKNAAERKEAEDKLERLRPSFNAASRELTKARKDARANGSLDARAKQAAVAANEHALAAIEEAQGKPSVAGVRLRLEGPGLARARVADVRTDADGKVLLTLELDTEQLLRFAVGG